MGILCEHKKRGEAFFLLLSARQSNPIGLVKFWCWQTMGVRRGRSTKICVKKWEKKRRGVGRYNPYRLPPSSPLLSHPPTGAEQKMDKGVEKKNNHRPSLTTFSADLSGRRFW
ncbi:hypothetical protein SUGI_0750660 [Cryptomeria japonica]|nr:hypothetical protein SUGI_0750660 [Cryptomeria japonica]